ncbi:ABC transporter ATP-binding protein [Novosphingobium bradum]|uniref:ABC transporter ATP-binding protein n=1 Tax=Novosphingobium bradum TaxID=1737444 RepID=A0ABV7IT95_9SPHN
MLKELYLIARPSGLKRLIAVLVVTVLQATVQTIAVFSLLPFLSAVSDIAAFRRSALGRLFVQVVGQGSSDHRIMLAAGTLALGILVLGNGLSLFSDHYRTKFAFSVAQDLRVRLLRQLVARRYEYFLGINSSVLIKNLVDDVGKVGADLVLPALDLVSRVLIVVFMAIAVLFVEPLVVVIGGVVVLAYNRLVMHPIRRKAHATSGAILDGIRQLHFEIFQALGGIKQILAAEKGGYFVNRVGQASSRMVRAMARVPMYAALPRSGFEVLVFGGMIVWVMSSIVAGENLAVLMPRIGFIAVVAYRVMPSLQLMFAQAALLNSSRQALDEVTGLLREQDRWLAAGQPPADLGEDRLGWSHSIRFERVSFGYQGADGPAVAELDFKIGKGERVAFVGPTGSGKSTLIDLLIGLLEPTGGRILVDDRPLDAGRIGPWRRTIGYVSQDLFLLDGSIAQNVAFGCDDDELDRARVLEIAEIAQARAFIETGQASGLDTVVGERGVRLSGGQRQRLALARALYFNPSVLVLDEATSALDPVTERNVTEAIRRGGGEVTVVTVAHRMSTVKDYDRIHFLENGRIVFSGSYNDLVENEDRFRSFIADSV